MLKSVLGGKIRPVTLLLFAREALAWKEKKRSLRNEKLKANRAPETEEQRKERLRVWRKTETGDHKKQLLAILKRL